jgi:hypothetical protein
MKDILKNDKEFKQAIGAFIIAFSELEFGLVFLCSMTEFDIRKKDEYVVKYLGFTFERKMQLITEFIENNLNELKPIWEKLKNEIQQLNWERRFLIHGFMTYYLPNKNIMTNVKVKGKVAIKKQTLDEIKGFTNRLHHLNTGKNGINGGFHTLFTETRIKKWNDLVNNNNKIIYCT